MPQCETAFAEGSKSFSTLTKNGGGNITRWGWIIDTTVGTPITETIWAGKNADAGTLSVTWSGTVATLTVDMNGDWVSEGFHLSFDAPTNKFNIAPGQYNANDVQWTYDGNVWTATVNAANYGLTTGDKVWIVVHLNACQ